MTRVWLELHPLVTARTLRCEPFPLPPASDAAKGEVELCRSKAPSSLERQRSPQRPCHLGSRGLRWLSPLRRSHKAGWPPSTAVGMAVWPARRRSSCGFQVKRAKTRELMSWKRDYDNAVIIQR